MTAIITKQNVKDGAFTGGNNKPSANGELEKLHVKGDTTIDGKINNEQIINIETRIKTLEETPADGLPFEDGLNDFIISADTLRTFENDEYNILEIEIDDITNYAQALNAEGGYEGDIIEIIFPLYMNL